MNMSFHIVDGPSKFDLMVSLFDVKEPRRTVEFRLEGVCDSITVAITSVQQEESSSESWNIEGLITNYRGISLKAHYSSCSRNGCLTFTPPFHYERNGVKSHKVVHPKDQRELEAYIDWLRDKGTGRPIPHANAYA